MPTGRPGAGARRAARGYLVLWAVDPRRACGLATASTGPETLRPAAVAPRRRLLVHLLGTRRRTLYGSLGGDVLGEAQRPLGGSGACRQAGGASGDFLGKAKTHLGGFAACRQAAAPRRSFGIRAGADAGADASPACGRAGFRRCQSRPQPSLQAYRASSFSPPCGPWRFCILAAPELPIVRAKKRMFDCTDSNIQISTPRPLNSAEI